MRWDERGLSLLEILVASVILGVALLGFTSSLQFIEQTHTVKERQLEALNYARETLESLFLPTRAYNSPELTAGDHTSKDTADPDLTLSDDIGLQGASRFYKVTAYDDGKVTGKQIDVTVSWTEEGGARQEQLRGFLVEPV
ncbi:MAG: type IV pilus modification PilV family protein [Candidatus Omnitrophota bacterium]|jgi:prepilin-type N-terminal cleavage/methylation domain-containing protein